jgi:Prokaryotic homologs of the JAB domain
MARVLAVSWLLCTSPLLANVVFDPGPAALHDRAVVACFVHLLRDAKLGFVNAERAAFLVLDEDGIRCVDWPVSNEFRTAHWSGSRPAGVVAVAHTHPGQFPNPSREDIDQAERSGITLFVITPRMVQVVHTDRRTEVLARTADWTRLQN